MDVFETNILLCIYHWAQSGCTSSHQCFHLPPHREDRSPTDCSESHFHEGPKNIYKKTANLKTQAKKTRTKAKCSECFIYKIRVVELATMGILMKNQRVIKETFLKRESLTGVY